MATLSKVLTITVIALAVVAVSAVAYSQLLAARDSYNSAISVSFHKSPATYDYSCGESDYQVYFTVRTTGPKTVADLSVAVTDPLCVGAVPVLANILNASSEISFYVQSAAENGTLTISGNNTLVLVKF